MERARQEFRIDAPPSIVNSCPPVVPFTFAAWIAPGPQQIGLSVIPAPVSVIPAPSLVIPAPSLVIPAPSLVIPAGSSHSCGVSSFPHPLIIPAPSHHSRTLSSFPHPHSSFPRRRESPVARLDAPPGELPSPSRHVAKGNGTPRVAVIAAARKRASVPHP